MKGHGQKLTRSRERAIAALLSERSAKAAAEKAGVSETTLYRWLRHPDFQVPYRQARRNVVEHALAGLQDATGSAVGALRRNMSCGRPASEIAAARIVLELSIRAVEVIDFDERLSFIEARLPGEESNAGH